MVCSNFILEGCILVFLRVRKARLVNRIQHRYRDFAACSFFFLSLYFQWINTNKAGLSWLRHLFAYIYIYIYLNEDPQRSIHGITSARSNQVGYTCGEVIAHVIFINDRTSRYENSDKRVTVSNVTQLFPNIRVRENVLFRSIPYGIRILEQPYMWNILLCLLTFLFSLSFSRSSIELPYSI